MLRVYLVALGLWLASAGATTLRSLYQFPNSTSTQSLENLSLRPSGELVITSTSKPCVYSLDPSDLSPTLQTVHCFDNATGTGTTGIAEISSDVFAVHVGVVEGLDTLPGSFSIWTLDFNQPDGPVVTEIADMSNAGGLNGMTAMPLESAILSADTTSGEVWHVDMNTGKSSIAGSNSHFLPSGNYPLGINGIHIDPIASRVFFANTANFTFGSMPYNRGNNTCTDFQTIAYADTGYEFDDFAVNWSTFTAYLVEHSNRILSIDLNTGNKTIIVDGPQNDVGSFEPTSVVLGYDPCILYVTSARYKSPTTGALSNGQVFEVNLCTDS